MILQLAVLAVLIILSGFFSSAETAFTSLSMMQIQDTVRAHPKRGKLIRYLTDRPDILLTTILIGNNLVNIAASALATYITTTLFGVEAIGIMTGVLTIIILIFGEVTPKRLAIAHNQFLCLHVVRVIYALSLILRPFVWIISKIGSLVTRLFGTQKKQHMTLEGIMHMMKIAEGMGVVENYETEFIKNIFRFNDVSLRAAMTHRTEIFSLDKNLTVEEAMPLIIAEGFSRIPCYEDEPERIVGVLLLKDLLPIIARGRKQKKLFELMHEPFFVSETAKVSEMFFKFKKERLNMAVVLDEYGGISGIVTQEDILEEMVGELYDEHEKQEEAKVKSAGKGVYRIAGDISVKHLNDVLGIDVPESRYSETISGYLAGRLGHLPQKDDTITVPEGTFIIEQVSKRRIISVRFEKSRRNAL
ncbi:MAG: hemolysin family protein [Spirochaetia bacterium]